MSYAMLLLHDKYGPELRYRSYVRMRSGDGVMRECGGGTNPLCRWYSFTMILRTKFSGRFMGRNILRQYRTAEKRDMETLMMVLSLYMPS